MQTDQDTIIIKIDIYSRVGSLWFVREGWKLVMLYVLLRGTNVLLEKRTNQNLDGVQSF